jgi:hypothetical protein
VLIDALAPLPVSGRCEVGRKYKLFVKARQDIRLFVLTKAFLHCFHVTIHLKFCESKQMENLPERIGAFI